MTRAAASVVPTVATDGACGWWQIQAAAMDTMASMRRRHRHLVKRSAAVKAADPDAVGPVAADGEVDGEADAGDSEGSDAEDGDAPATGNAGTDAGAAPATAPVVSVCTQPRPRVRARVPKADRSAVV